MISLNKLTVLVGLILSSFLVAPLYMFLSGLEGGLNIEVEPVEEGVMVTIYYGVKVPLTDARLSIKAGGQVYEASAEELGEGDRLSLILPLEGAENIEYIRFEGSIAGLYRVSITLRGVTGD